MGISENLDRADLTALEHDEHVAEWERLTEAKGVLGQSAPKLSTRGRAGEGRPESGVRAAVRVLGLERTEVRRAIKVDGLSPEAKQAAREVGLDDNRRGATLHRADLTAAERDDHITEWARLTDAKLQLAQLAPIESTRADGKGHRHESGVRAAARVLGLERTDVQRAIKVASRAPEAKAACTEAGLDNNRTGLLKALASAVMVEIPGRAEVAIGSAG